MKMNSKMTMVGGPVLLGVLIALTQYIGWNPSLNYLWAGASIVWGLSGLMFNCKN